jgi:hypothetical protein
MICDEPLARRWWGKAHDSSGLVWCKSGLPAGISGCFRFAVDWLAGVDVVTGLSQAVRNVVGRREMR